MGITWSPAATDDFLSILKKVDELFGKMIAIKVSNKIQTIYIDVTVQRFFDV